MFFRIIVIAIALAALYGGWQSWSVYSFYHQMRSPDASFTVINGGNQSNLTIVEFVNYNCLPCRKAHLILLDYAERNKDVTLIVRPVPFANSKTEAEYALAAGLQGKFLEFDKAMADYMGDYDEKFYSETCSVYDIDCERLRRDAAGEEVFDLAADNVAAASRLEFQSVPALLIGKTVYEPEKELTLPDLIRMVQAERNR